MDRDPPEPGRAQWPWRLAAPLADGFRGAELNEQATQALHDAYNHTWLMTGWLLGFWILKRPDVRDVQSQWLTLPVSPRMLMAARLLMLALAQVVMPAATAWLFMRCVLPELAYPQAMAVAGLGLAHWVLASFSALAAPGWRGLVHVVLSAGVMTWGAIGFRLVLGSMGDQEGTSFALYHMANNDTVSILAPLLLALFSLGIAARFRNPQYELQPRRWYPTTAIISFLTVTVLFIRHPQWDHPDLVRLPTQRLNKTPVDAESERLLKADDRQNRILRRAHRYYAVGELQTENLISAENSGCHRFTGQARPGEWHTTGNEGKLAVIPRLAPGSPVVRSHWSYTPARHAIAEDKRLMCMDDLMLGALAKVLPEQDWKLNIRNSNGKLTGWSSLHEQNVRPRLSLRVTLPNKPELGVSRPTQLS